MYFLYLTNYVYCMFSSSFSGNRRDIFQGAMAAENRYMFLETVFNIHSFKMFGTDMMFKCKIMYELQLLCQVFIFLS